MVVHALRQNERRGEVRRKCLRPGVGEVMYAILWASENMVARRDWKCSDNEKISVREWWGELIYAVIVLLIVITIHFLLPGNKKKTILSVCSNILSHPSPRLLWWWWRLLQQHISIYEKRGRRWWECSIIVLLLCRCFSFPVSIDGFCIKGRQREFEHRGIINKRWSNHISGCGFRLKTNDDLRHAIEGEVFAPKRWWYMAYICMVFPRHLRQRWCLAQQQQQQRRQDVDRKGTFANR